MKRFDNFLNENEDPNYIPQKLIDIINLYNKDGIENVIQRYERKDILDLLKVISKSNKELRAQLIIVMNYIDEVKNFNDALNKIKRLI